MEGASSTAITSGISTITEVTTSVWSLMTSNPLVMVFVGAALLSVGISIIRKLTKGRA